MKCVNCGSEMKAATGTHRYTESGLSNVILVNVETRACQECGEREVVIPKIEKLHRMIARTIVREQGQLGPAHVRFLRKWLGFASTDFALIMGVRPETVSRWENKDAAYPLSPQADRLLRLLVANEDRAEKYPIDLFKHQTRVKPEPLKLRAPDWKKAVS